LASKSSRTVSVAAVAAVTIVNQHVRDNLSNKRRTQ
jgi:hypothetical protein